MIESLIDIDKQIFIAIHHGLANPVFDMILPWLREPKAWIPLYLLFAFLAIQKYKLQGLYIVLAAAVIVALCDRFSAGFMKPYFERLRPCHEPSLTLYIRDLVDCGGQYGFISSHATNHFGLAVIFAWFFKKVSSMSCIPWVFYVWAGAISLAQIYVAKHYFGDVLVGALAGILIAKVLLAIFTKFIVIKSLPTH